MSLSKILKYYILSIFLLGFCFSKIISPEQLESKEVLKIYNKEREYFRLIENKLTYFVEGPSVFTMYSRMAVPKMSDDIKAYKFKVLIDDIDSFIVEHDHRKDLNVKSDMHPGHAYTVSGKDIINISKGQHRIELIPVNDSSNLLIRSASNSFKKISTPLNEINPENSNYINYEVLKTKDKNLKYYSLSNKNLNNIFFNVDGPSVIKITSRISFDQNDKNGYYHFKIRENNKLISNHHMFSSVSKGTKVLNNDDLKVGKYRTTYITVPDGNHKYELELIEPLSQTVYFRFED